MWSKPTKQTRAPNAAEKRYRNWLDDRTCCTCGNTGIVGHHPGGKSYRKNKQLCGHWFVIPLCPECHDFRHRYKPAFLALYGPERELWLCEVVLYSLDDDDKAPPEDIKIAIMESGI